MVVDWSTIAWSPGDACPTAALDPERPLRLTGGKGLQSAGFGSKLGWWISAAAVAEVLNRTVSSPLLHAVRNPGKTDPGVPASYNFSRLHELMSFPARLRLGVEGSGAPLVITGRDGGDTLPNPLWQEVARDAYYLPETMYWQWSLWDKLKPRRFVPRCVSRTDFFAAYNRVRAQIRPLRALRNPPPRTYLALHVRRRAWKWGPPVLKSETKLALVEIRRLTGLPWLVLTASQNITHGLRMFLHQHLSVRTLGRSHAVAGTEYRHKGDEIGDDGSIEDSLVRDFFPMADSSGTLVDSAGFGANAESDACGWTVFLFFRLFSGVVCFQHRRHRLRGRTPPFFPLAGRGKACAIKPWRHPRNPRSRRRPAPTFTTGGCVCQQ